MSMMMYDVYDDVWVWCLSCDACYMYVIYVSMHDAHIMFDALDSLLLMSMMFYDIFLI